MKKLLQVFILSGLTTIAASAQSSVFPKDLSGTWKMVFDIEKKADSALERMLLSAVDGFLDGIDIQFEFEEDGDLVVKVVAFGEEEEERSDWQINDQGELVIGNSDHFESDDTVWLFKDGRLVAYEYEDGERVLDDEGVYLERIE